MRESAAGTTSGGYARYVGRVGGLAFALGVGAAILSGTAVASADTSESSTGSGATSSSSASSSSASSPSKASDRATKRASLRDARRAASDTRKTKAETDTDESSDGAAAPQEDADVAVAEPKRSHRFSFGRRLVDTPAAAPVDSVADTAAAAAAPAGSFFGNVTPTLSHDASEDIVAGDTIVGNLHPLDPDSPKLRYTSTRPARGTVKVNIDGTFVYTPNSTYAGHDSFRVTVSDTPSGFHVHGGNGLLGLFTLGLLGNIGHKTTETVFVGSQQTVVASGLTQPVDFRFLSDGRIVVAEKGGAIKIIESGTVLEQPVITLSVNNLFERGIQGIAVDPQFSENGYLYVAYTTAGIHDRLSRVTVVGNTADPASELALFETTETVTTSHRGGGLAFGPDGKLYWAKGDNLSPANAQDLTNIHGKVLRINPDGSVPSDNPDLGPGANPLIWAYGFRNPYRMSFTPDGKLLVADVGETLFEELNLVTAGGNYGWPNKEGICTSDCAGTVNPIYAYAHGDTAAITAGLLYTGGLLGAAYQNKVFIADEAQGWIKVLTCSPNLTSCSDAQMFDSDAGLTVMLAQGPDGYLYQLVYNGSLVRILAPGNSSAGETSV